VTGAADLAADVVRLATASGTTLAVAESLTAGMLCARIADVPGASVVLRGGVVVYATDLKSSLLGLDPVLLAERGAVDPEVALAMAAGVWSRLEADVGVATTGVAGPASQDGVEPGTVYIAVCRRDRGLHARTAGMESLIAGGRSDVAGDLVSVTAHGAVRKLSIEGDRAAVRAGATQAALDLLRAALTHI